MNACLTTGLMQQFHRLFGVLVLSLFSLQVMAADSPVVVSVDHRVTATFSKPQFDARKGVYTTQVRIQNRSAASLMSPLRLTLEQFDGKNVKPLNAQGIGKDGQPYFEFALPKGVLAAGGVTESVKVIFVVEKNKDIGAAKERVAIRSRIPSSFVYHVSAGVELAPLEPRAEPYALTVDSGKVNVRFSVRLIGKTKLAETVYLRRIGDGKGIAMNDIGKDGDLVAKDGIYGVNISVETSKMKPDTCLYYEALINVGRSEVVSTPLSLYVSSFPVRVAPSNTAKPLVLSDGAKAVADEILVTALNANTETIRRLAKVINATVVGSIPPHNMYQFKLPEAVGESQLLSLIAKLNAQHEVQAASPNGIGDYAFTPSDAQFGNQHGLQLTRAHDVWDASAIGSGVIVTVLDTVIDRTHPDFGTPGDCQLVDNDCGVPIAGAVSHGTQVAGVIGAKTNNALGVAGVAYGSKIKSVPVISDAAHMTQGFTDAASYGLATVVNASISAGPWGAVFAGTVSTLCTAVESVVFNGAPIAVVVNAVGNNGTNNLYYPARCNDATRPEHIGLAHKDLLITVANSVSAPTSDCQTGGGGLQNAMDTLCNGNTSSAIGGSNYGAWVDIAAPGSAIWSTALGGGYIAQTGTSFAAPIASGAAAILLQCGVPLDQVEATLKTSGSNVHVAYPPGGAADWVSRLDIYRALNQVNHAPTGVAPATNSVNEGSPIGTLISTLSKIDADTCDKFTYSITGVNPGGFTLDANTGELLVGGVVPDYEGVPSHSYTLTVQVTDFFGLTFSQPVTVNLNNLNDSAPVIGGGASASISVPENTTAVTTVTATDADNLGALSYTLSGDDASAFSIDSSGVLTFNSAPNYEAPADVGGNNVYNVTVQVSDGVNTDSQAITVTVTNASEAPTGVPIVDPDPATTANRKVPQVLTANASPVYNPDGWAISGYQWRRSGTDIPGATAVTHTLGLDDVGSYMSVCVIYTDGGMPAVEVSLCSGTDSVAVGDPHITTVDGLRYDFQGAGEFVALRGANGMEIQLRMAPVSTAPPLADEHTGLTSGASVNTAVAARVGTHRVTFQLDTSPNAAPNTFVLRVDGVPKTLPLPEGGIDLGDGGRVMSQPSGIQIDFPDQTTLMINNNWGTFYGASWLHINVFHTSAYEGIMGARSKGSWLPRLSDGSAFGAKPASLHDRYIELYVKFADSWRVNNDTTLFYYDEGTSTATFTNKAWPTENGPYVVGNEPVAKPLDLKAAQLACRDVVGKNEIANCIFDVRVVGHADLAKGHLLNQKVRLGATNVIVRGPVKLNERGDLAIAATVARHAMVVPQVKGLRNVPAGTVQFMLGGKLLGKPVKLDEKGQAKLVVKQQILERFNVGKQAITARYLPTKDRGNVFLPSISRQLTREVVKLSPVVRDIR